MPLGHYLDQYRGKTALITGGLGFIGSNLARRLVELGARVLIVDSMIPGYGGNFFNIHDIEEKLRVNIADVRDQAAMLALYRRIGEISSGPDSYDTVAAREAGRQIRIELVG